MKVYTKVIRQGVVLVYAYDNDHANFQAEGLEHDLLSLSFDCDFCKRCPNPSCSKLLATRLLPARDRLNQRHDYETLMNHTYVGRGPHVVPGHPQMTNYFVLGFAARVCWWRLSKGWNTG